MRCGLEIKGKQEGFCTEGVKTSAVLVGPECAVFKCHLVALGTGWEMGRQGVLGCLWWAGQGRGSHGVTGGTWLVRLCNQRASAGSLQSGILTAEYEVLLTTRRGGSGDVQGVKPITQRDLGTWDRGQSRAVVHREALSIARSG